MRDSEILEGVLPVLIAWSNDWFEKNQMTREKADEFCAKYPDHVFSATRRMIAAINARNSLQPRRHAILLVDYWRRNVMDYVPAGGVGEITTKMMALHRREQQRLVGANYEQEDEWRAVTKMADAMLRVERYPGGERHWIDRDVYEELQRL
jgi:hypothetical protein